MAVSLIGAIIIWMQPFEGQLYASVYIDDEFVERVSLESEYREIEINTVYGYNKLIISEGLAFIYKSDCEYKDCEDKKTINRPGGIIVCAPHHLLIKIEGENR